MKPQGFPAIESWAVYGILFSRSSFRSNAAIIAKLDEKLPGRVRAFWSDVAGSARSNSLKIRKDLIEVMLSDVSDPVIEFYGNAILMVWELVRSERVAEAERMLRVAQQYLQKGEMPKKVEAFFQEIGKLKTTPSTHMESFSQVLKKHKDRKFEIDELAVRYVEATKLGNALEKELEQVLHLDSRFRIQLTKLQNIRGIYRNLSESEKAPVARSNSVDPSDQGMDPSDWSGDDVDFEDSGD